MLQGTTDDERSVGLRVFHQDPYLLTAIPIAATVQQMLSAPKPGVWTQAAFVEPRPFFENLERMGLKVELEGEVADGNRSTANKEMSQTAGRRPHEERAMPRATRRRGG